MHGIFSFSPYLFFVLFLLILWIILSRDLLSLAYNFKVSSLSPRDNKDSVSTYRHLFLTKISRSDCRLTGSWNYSDYTCRSSSVDGIKGSMEEKRFYFFGLLLLSLFVRVKLYSVGLLSGSSKFRPTSIFSFYLRQWTRLIV